jgi:D-glycero-D-manno-heptose 1,7-bisphosphate phosphatase
MSRSALFLDRDGVVNMDHAYVYRPEDFVFIAGIFALVAAANRSGKLVVIVTNQAGIGRGYYSESQFHGLMSWVGARFAERGCRIDAVYFSPFHPEHGIGPYRRITNCRKPAPGMLIRAADELSIDLSSSILIGDRLTDLQAGSKAGVGQLIWYVPDRICEVASTQRADNDEQLLQAKVINTLIEALPYVRGEKLNDTSTPTC